MFGNWIKTSILMAGIVVLFATVGMLLGGQKGMLIALLFAGGMNMYAYWFSDQMVLKMYNAQQVDAGTARRVLRNRRRTGAACRTAHAQGVYHRRGTAQCVCHRAQPGARGGCRYHRDYPIIESARIAWRDGA